MDQKMMQKRCITNLEELQIQIEAEKDRINKKFAKVSKNLKSLDAVAKPLM